MLSLGGGPNHFVIIPENEGNAYQEGRSDSVQNRESFGFARKAQSEIVRNSFVARPDSVYDGQILPTTEMPLHEIE